MVCHAHDGSFVVPFRDEFHRRLRGHRAMEGVLQTH
jgi:hypothetical protein